MQAQAERERQARAMNILLEGMHNNSSVIIVPSSAVESLGLGTTTGLTALPKEFGTEKKE